MDKNRTLYWIFFALLMSWIAFMGFYKLGVKYVDPWDEARHGVNAWEMLNGGSMVQSTYLRQADYYNLKPPLSMWCIMIGLKIFSDPVIGLRFYSVICYLIVCVLTALFLRRFGDLESLLGLAFLSVNMTPFLAHMIRAGDADSLYVLLFTIAMLAMMRIRDDHRFLYLCGLAFSLAFLTKSFHAMMIAAIGGLFLLCTKQLFSIKFKEWCMFILCIILPVLIWGLLRYRIDGTAFFIKMWETDVRGRTGGELHSNPSPFWYYASYYFGLMSGKLQIYLWALLLAVAGLILRLREYLVGRRDHAEIRQKNDHKNASLRFGGQEILGFILWAVLPFVAFSAVSNKLLWYIYPCLIPLLAGAGVTAAGVLKKILAMQKNHLRIILAVLFSLVLIFLGVWYGAGTFKIVNAQTYNEFQILVRAVAGDEKAIALMQQISLDKPAVPEKVIIVPDPGESYCGCKAYVDYDGSNNHWAQQDVFVAEAYGDFKCCDGGVLAIYTDSYMSGEERVVFTSRKMYENCKPLYEDGEMIAAMHDYLAFAIPY
ncbi:MAG: glycosyltransferase family 39 protein [Lachnospiraceae bacterium]|nr:glycosyltransferase family 39 protein [Lachnospiraceae bacterium]